MLNPGEVDMLNASEVGVVRFAIPGGWWWDELNQQGGLKRSRRMNV